MRKITLQQKLRYQLDRTLSRGSMGLIGWLFLWSTILVFGISLLVILTGIDPERRHFFEMTWASLMRAQDPGTMADDQGSWAFRFAMLAVTLGGIFTISILIGLLTTGLESKLEQLRKGRSFVAEEGHTIILGWSSQIFTIISELVQANANRSYSCITILAEQDKVEMEDEIYERVGHTGKTRIVCRTGSPLELTELEIVNPHAALSIIILAPEGEVPDAYVLKSILALVNNPNRHPEPYHIVAVIRDRRNLDITRMVGGNEVALVPASELVAKITAQTCRKAGLSIAYTELLEFEGNEIYFKEESKLVGKTFGEALFAYEACSLIGIRFKDGRVQVRPALQTPIKEGDKVIIIAENDNSIKLSKRTDYPIDQAVIQEMGPVALLPERTLILGWNKATPAIIRELDHYVAPGSEVTVVSSDPRVSDILNTKRANQGEKSPYRNLTVSTYHADTTSRPTLDALEAYRYNNIIVLSTNLTAGSRDVQQADARTLITLLHLRDIADKHGHPFTTVSQILDSRNRQLAEVTRVDDFIVSDKLISLMLSQISQNKEIAAVFQDLFDAQGSEVYLKPVEDYVLLNHPVTFYTIVESAQRQDEVAIGYRLLAHAYKQSKSFGITINPPKAEYLTFSAGDRIIVIAECQL
jgi:voltage-gated potassium channel Kch